MYSNNNNIIASRINALQQPSVSLHELASKIGSMQLPDYDRVQSSAASSPLIPDADDTASLSSNDDNLVDAPNHPLRHQDGQTYYFEIANNSVFRKDADMSSIVSSTVEHKKKDVFENGSCSLYAPYRYYFVHNIKLNAFVKRPMLIRIDATVYNEDNVEVLNNHTNMIKAPESSKKTAKKGPAQSPSSVEIALHNNSSLVAQHKTKAIINGCSYHENKKQFKLVFSFFVSFGLGETPVLFLKMYSPLFHLYARSPSKNLNVANNKKTNKKQKRPAIEDDDAGIEKEQVARNKKSRTVGLSLKTEENPEVAVAHAAATAVPSSMMVNGTTPLVAPTLDLFNAGLAALMEQFKLLSSADQVTACNSMLACLACTFHQQDAAAAASASVGNVETTTNMTRDTLTSPTTSSFDFSIYNPSTNNADPFSDTFTTLASPSLAMPSNMFSPKSEWGDM